MNNFVMVYRIFDITNEIDLRQVEQLLSTQKPITRMRLSRVRPKSIHIDNPPVSVDLAGREITLAGSKYLTTVSAKIFDLGIISIVIKIGLPEEISYDGLLELSVYLNNTEELEPLFKSYLEIIVNIIKLKDMEVRQEFIEDFVIWFFREWNDEWNPVPILLSEREQLSEQTRKDTLKNSFSYGTGDLAVITWDSALVYDSEGSNDIPDLLEFASTQLLELRYYDTVLSWELDRMHDAIGIAEKKSWLPRLRQYRRIMKNLMELVIDITEITEKIQKQLKVTEDVFYARVYGAALSIFRTRDWTESIHHKVALIQRNYSMLSDEIINRRSTMLEAAIVALFVFEVVMGFVRG